MVDLKIGFDIDGVIVPLSEIEIRLTHEFPNLERIYYDTRKIQLIPQDFISNDDEAFMITGRRAALIPQTEAWHKKYFPNISLVILSVEPYEKDEDIEDWMKRSAVAKAKKINELELDVYFEDMPATVRELRKLCPNTKIIQYGGRID